MINVNSIINLNFPRIKQLTQAQSQALEQTAEALHTEVVQAQVFPRDTGAMQNERSFIKAGETVSATYEDGAMATNTITKEKGGRVSLITSAPQARRLYFHPEYHFQKCDSLGSNAFGQCEQLKSVFINKKLTNTSGGLWDYDAVRCARLCRIPRYF